MGDNDMARMKLLMIICDGMADRPSEELGGRTPLDAADTPVMDRLAKEGQCGMMNPIGIGIVPGSDTAHLSLLGYDPYKYYCGRGTLEAAGNIIKTTAGSLALYADSGIRMTGGSSQRVDAELGLLQVMDPIEKRSFGYS